MDNAQIIAAIIAPVLTFTGLSITYALGAREGRRRMVEWLVLHRQSRPAKVELGGEFEHSATDVVWPLEDMSELWNQLRADGDKLEPDQIERLMREMDDARAREAAELAAHTEAAFEHFVTARYARARQAIWRKDQDARKVHRGREVALGGSYIFAFGHMPLSPVESFDRRLSMAVGRIGAAAVSVERQRAVNQRRARKADGR